MLVIIALASVHYILRIVGHNIYKTKCTNTIATPPFHFSDTYSTVGVNG